MNLDREIRRLIDILPASGRMYTKIINKPQQPQVIDTPFPVPWNRERRPVNINFNLWQRLPKSQQDLLILRAVSSQTGVRWFKPDLYQGIVGAGLVGLTVELVQGDAVGIVVAGGLSAIAASQIWRSNRSVQKQLEADEAAIKVALRRGYTETEAAGNLLDAIEAVAQLEGRSGLDFTELVRAQNLKAIANLSAVGVPEKVRQE